MEGFLYWIRKANMRYELSKPPCCHPLLWWRKKLLIRLKSRIAHFLICHRQDPWKLLPHKAGCEVEGKYLDEYLEINYPKPPS